MARRPDADEQALWARVAAEVTPLAGRTAPSASLPLPTVSARPAAARSPSPTSRVLPQAPQLRAISADTLDGGWDRRLRRGAISPDLTVDLHGHNLAAAHAVLDRAIERGIADGARTLLVVTGRPPRRTPDGSVTRGLIRGSIEDWLAHSRHGARIAAVRGAHPRHGGAGALYVILRRPRVAARA